LQISTANQPQIIVAASPDGRVIIMNAKPRLETLSRSFAAVPSLQLPALAAAGLLSWGRQRRNRRRDAASSLYFLAAGLVVGAGAALLLSPSSGKDVRSRVGKLLGGGVGKILGEQAGAHPVGTTRVVKAAREVLGQHEE
jgi:hypothetical protein